MANKARRFSGRLKIELNFNDRTNQYKARLCPVVKGERCETVYVGPPRHLTRAVDSPRAYDDAARAAIAFSSDTIQNQAAYSGSGYAISRGRRRYAKGHPRRKKR